MKQIRDFILSWYFWLSPIFFLIYNYNNLPIGIFICFINAVATVIFIAMCNRYDEIMSIRGRCLRGEITPQQAMILATPKKPEPIKKKSEITNRILKFKDDHPILVAIIIERITEYCKKEYHLELTRGELAGIIVAVNQIKNSDVIAIVEFAKEHPIMFLMLVQHLSDTYMYYRKRGEELKPQQIAAIIIAFNILRT